MNDGCRPLVRNSRENRGAGSGLGRGHLSSIGNVIKTDLSADDKIKSSTFGLLLRREKAPRLESEPLIQLIFVVAPPPPLGSSRRKKQQEDDDDYDSAISICARL